MFPEGIELHCKKGVDETRLSTRQSKKNDLRPPDVLDQSTNEKKAADDISVLQRRTLATVFSYEYCQNTIIHTLVLYLVVTILSTTLARFDEWFLALISDSSFSGCAGDEHEYRLTKYLLSNYESSVRPVGNSSEPIVVLFGLSIYHIIGMRDAFDRLLRFSYKIVVKACKKTS